MSDAMWSPHDVALVGRVLDNLRDSDRLRERTWHVTTGIVAVFLVLWGLFYAIGGDASGGPSWGTIREMGGVVVHAGITVVVGGLILAALGTRFAQVALAVAFLWTLLEFIAFLTGSIVAQQGPGGPIVWGALVGPLLTWNMLTAPDVAVLLKIADRVQAAGTPRRRAERRGRVA